MAPHMHGEGSDSFWPETKTRPRERQRCPIAFDERVSVRELCPFATAENDISAPKASQLIFPIVLMTLSSSCAWTGQKQAARASDEDLQCRNFLEMNLEHLTVRMDHLIKDRSHRGSSNMKLVILLALATSVPSVQAQAAGEVSNTNFHREVQCMGHVPLDPGQAYHVTRGLGRLGCAKLCAQEEACLSYTTSGPDCLLYPVRLQTCGPSPSPPHASYYFKRWCYNGGTLILDKCRCPDQFRGDRCQNVMKDCKDLMEWTNTSGVYWVEPPAAPHPFQVYCQMEYGGRTYLQKHYREACPFSFNRTWDEYLNGFGNLSSKSFWLGLRQMYWLTAGGNKELGIQVEYFQTNRASNISSLFYGEFRMGDEDMDFEILPNYGGKWGALSNVVNCLGGAVVGSKFATFDHGPNSPTRECALRYGTGWWINPRGPPCSMPCHPNGRLRSKDEAFRTGDVFFQGLDQSLDIDAVYMFLEK